MNGVARAVKPWLYPVGAALVTLLVPFALLAIAVQRGADCTAGTRFPWAWPTFVAVAVIAISVTITAWLVPAWRQRRLASGATVGLIMLTIMVLLVLGGLDYQASMTC